jgi:mRNA interferase HigB
MNCILQGYSALMARDLAASEARLRSCCRAERGEASFRQLVLAGSPSLIARAAPNQRTEAQGTCSHIGNMIWRAMRVIARNTLVDFWSKHAEAKVALERWYKLVRAAHWSSTDEVQKAAPKSKVLNRERVRFEVAGGNYRLVIAFDFRRQVALVKFIGTHAEYDRIDALNVSQF